MSRVKNSIRRAWRKVRDDAAVRQALVSLAGAVIAIVSTALRKRPHL